VLAGGGECSQVNWSFAGLAMPAWVLVAALVLGFAGVRANLRQ
jgi:disulfide bond formation protein DsbB